MTDKKIEKYTSPTGTYIWCKVNEPDFKFAKDYGAYSTKLRLTPEEAAPLHAILAPLVAEAYEIGRAKFGEQAIPSQKKNPFVEADYFDKEYDAEGNETGYEIFSFKANAGGKKKDGSLWEFKPAVFSASGTKLNNVPKIGNGSTGKVNFSVNPYFVPATGRAGISLRLNALKLLSLNEGAGASAAAYGFDEAEDGYEPSENSSFETAGAEVTVQPTSVAF